MAFTSTPSKKKQVRQPPSVPFIWEEKPGLPIKNWKPRQLSSVKPPSFIPLPLKLIASVPFNWEEEPGKPLPHFSQPTELIALSTAIVPYSSSNDDQQQENIHKFESSVPCLLANCLELSTVVSSAVPVQNIFSKADENGILVISSSSSDSESDSSTSSYATGFSSLVGTPFLECLFPLRPPTAGFLEHVGSTDDMGSHIFPGQKHKDFSQENNNGVMVRRPPTLGELIMKSRRRSCQRKAIQMKQQNFPMEFNKAAFGCGIFGPSIKMIERLQWSKYQPRWKLV